MNRHFYIMTDGLPSGPYTLAELRARGLSPDAEVWDESRSCRVMYAQLMPPAGLHGDMMIDDAVAVPDAVAKPDTAVPPMPPQKPAAIVGEAPAVAASSTHFRISGYIRILLATLVIVIAAIVAGVVIYIAVLKDY